ARARRHARAGEEQPQPRRPPPRRDLGLTALSFASTRVVPDVLDVAGLGVERGDDVAPHSPAPPRGRETTSCRTPAVAPPPPALDRDFARLFDCLFIRHRILTRRLLRKCRKACRRT